MDIKEIDSFDENLLSEYTKNANEKFSEEEFEYFSKNGCPVYFSMDSALLGICNRYDDQIYYSVMAYDDTNTGGKSYGTNSFYYLMDRYKRDYEYIYIAEYYPNFEYKSKIQGFEYWNGSKWNKV